MMTMIIRRDGFDHHFRLETSLQNAHTSSWRCFDRGTNDGESLADEAFNLMKIVAVARSSPDRAPLLEKIAVMVVTSSADRPQIYSERVRNLSGLNHTKLEQDGGNSARRVQDLLQA